jgi:hypothetical protein
MMPSGHRTQETDDCYDSQNMMWLWGQFFMIPVTALVSSVELLLRTVHEMQQLSNRGIQVIAGSNAGLKRVLEERSAVESHMPNSNIISTTVDNRKTTNEEDKILSDTYNKSYNYCNPDPNAGKCLKLWRYKVLFIKRDYEHAFPEAEDLVSDDVSDITAWKIAEFIQSLSQRRVTVPPKWLDNDYYPDLKFMRIGDNPDAPTEEEVDTARDNGTQIYLVGLSEDDKRYLRLFSQILAEYTREEPEYDKEQVDVLREIARNMRSSNSSEKSRRKYPEKTS